MPSREPTADYIVSSVEIRGFLAEMPCAAKLSPGIEGEVAREVVKGFEGKVIQLQSARTASGKSIEFTSVLRRNTIQCTYQYPTESKARSIGRSVWLVVWLFGCLVGTSRYGRGSSDPIALMQFERHITDVQKSSKRLYDTAWPSSSTQSASLPTPPPHHPRLDPTRSSTFTLTLNLSRVDIENIFMSETIETEVLDVINRTNGTRRI
uniref:Uncharacterized protein n=1 Tax=Vespula pensylvanica TaxID=30213 RepID=A0A834K0D5_VESPE|nr:hypothetical protein H0235_016539 [Vespula pensylvanica]